ncbi:MAG: flagellar hook-length control protein FliK [Nitrospirota bacterium]
MNINVVVNKGETVVLLARPDGKPISLVSGDAVSADVIDIIDSGLVMLRITPPLGKSEDTQGAVLLARTNVPLSEGDRITLKVMGGDKEINLKFMGFESPQSPVSAVTTAASHTTTPVPVVTTDPASAPAPTVVTVAQKVQLLLSELTDARLSSSDFQALHKILTDIPSSVKNKYPEFKMLESLIPDMEQLNAQTLRASVEESGILFETNVKQSAIQELDNAPDVVLAKNTLNAIVQKAVEGFQNPQTEGHTRIFLNDLAAVTYKGIQGLTPGNASDTLNMLNHAIDDCLAVVAQDKDMHTNCNCGDVLSAVKQKLEAALQPQSSMNDNIITTVQQGKLQLASISVDYSDVFSPVKQMKQRPDALITPPNYPKDELTAMLEQGRPHNTSVDSSDVLAAVRQKLDALITPQISTKDTMIIMADQAKPHQGTGAEGSDVLTPRPDAVTVTQAPPKDDVIAAMATPKDKPITHHVSQTEEHLKAPLNINNDQKALLLKIRDILQDDMMADALKYSPAKHDELLDTVEKFIKNIEYYQLSSRANDMVYTYLPFLWNELRDADLMFKKNKYHAKKSFTCDINLDLDRLGKISISVTTSDGGFFVSFNAEKDKTKDLISENKGELEKRFAAVGLTLKIINVGQKSKLGFAEKATSGGLDLRI